MISRIIGSWVSRLISLSPFWIGFDEPRSLGNNETGGSNAAPIFREVVGAALTGSPPVPFRRPPGITLLRVASGNGSIMEPFRPGTRKQRATLAR